MMKHGVWVDTKKMKRNRMQRERKLERDDETLATVLACVLGIAIACVSSVGRRQGKGRGRRRRKQGTKFGTKFDGAQEEKERDKNRALQFGRRSWFFFFSLSKNCPVCPGLPLLTYLLTMETRRESPVFSFSFFLFLIFKF